MPDHCAPAHRSAVGLPFGKYHDCGGNGTVYPGGRNQHDPGWAAHRFRTDQNQKSSLNLTGLLLSGGGRYGGGARPAGFGRDGAPHFQSGPVDYGWRRGGILPCPFHVAYHRGHPAPLASDGALRAGVPFGNLHRRRLSGSRL